MRSNEMKTLGDTCQLLPKSKKQLDRKREREKKDKQIYKFNRFQIEYEVLAAAFNKQETRRRQRAN